GAGGLSSSIGEMAQDTGGFELHLDRAPLKYPGLQPWEILISEAQERMTVAVPPDKLVAFLSLSAEMEVESSDLGQFTDSGYYHCLYQGKTVTWLSMEFLHEGVPQMRIPAIWTPPNRSEPQLPADFNVQTALLKLLGSLNICSKESVVRRYDHEVQAGTIVKPLTGVVNDGPSDAAVVRPLADSYVGTVVAHGICPRYSDIDTYQMMANAIDEGLRNYVAVGGRIDHVAGLDNFCWCDPVKSDKTPDGEYKAAQLVRANQALYDYCVAFGVPLISGKDSMKNDYQIGETKISIPPTVLFSVIGKIDDVRLATTMDAKRPGDLVYLLGVTANELGASELYAQLSELGANVPQVDAVTALARYRTLNAAQNAGLIASCHDLSDGGLAVALAETAFSGGLGISIDLSKVETRGKLSATQILFSESASRLLVTVHPENQGRFTSLFARQSCSLLGEVTTTAQLQVIDANNCSLIAASLDELKAAWQAPLREM
ncbi:MAG: AIR synthase-related protein, partial [Desulfuromonadales bacterium]|nr:AIR synthase-related protein [Desulfuromonadales bacterium]